MLLGCCHCEGTTSSSSGSSSSVSSVSSASVLPIGCGPCVVVPQRWLITVSGWTGLTTPYDSCCESQNASYICHNYTKPPFSTSCALWRSDEVCKDNRIFLPATVPTCEVVGTRRVVLIQMDFLSPFIVSTLTVGISIATGGTLGSPTYQIATYSMTFNNPATCITGGTLDFVSNANTVRCTSSTATVTAEPI